MGRAALSNKRAARRKKPEDYKRMLNSRGALVLRGRSTYHYALPDITRLITTRNQFPHDSMRDLGKRVDRSPGWCKKWLECTLPSGEIRPPAGHGGLRQKRMSTRMVKYLLALVRKHKSAHYVRYARKISRRFQVNVTANMVDYWLTSFGFSRKRLTAWYEESLRPWPRARRAAFLQFVANEVRQHGRETVRNWHFIDIKPVNQTDFNARYGLSQGGSRASSYQPSDRGMHHDLMASISFQGLESYVMIEGHVTMHDVAEWLRYDMIPSCCRPGDIIWSDNAGYFEKPNARRLIGAVCAEAGVRFCFLPPRMPWYNPIEHIFSILVEKLSQMSRTARSSPITSVYNALAEISVEAVRGMITNVYH